VRFQDYVCHAIEAPSSSIPSASSGMSHPLAHYISYDNFSPLHRAFLASITSHTEPRHYSYAIRDPNWHATMSNAISALEANHAWEGN